MSSTKSQVALATSISNLSSSQSQKDYHSEESASRQNSFGSTRRGNMKGKHLTRSHAMRESTSPPRTPTPRTENAATSPNGHVSNYTNNTYQQYHDVNDNAYNNNNVSGNNKLHAQSTSNPGNSPIGDAPIVIVTSQHKQQQQQQNVAALCNETEFPKLSPPKSNKIINLSANSSSGGGNGALCGGNGMGEYVGNAHHNQIRNSTVITNGSGGNSITDNKSECINKGNVNNNNNNCNNNNSTHSSNASGNNMGSSNGYKKLVVDLKTIDTSEQQTPKNGVNNPNHHNSSNNSSNKHHGAMQQHTLNVAENQQIELHRTQQQLQLQQTSAAGSMNYQSSDGALCDKEHCCPRNENQSTNMSTSNEEDSQPHPKYDRQVIGNSNSSGGEGTYGGSSCGVGSSGVGGGSSNNNGNKNKRSTSNSKGSKPRLKHIGGSSSGSVDTSSNSNNTSGFISRVFNNSENSSEQFTDYGGTDLLSFFKETLNRTSKDRIFLLKTEKELIELVQDKSRSEYRFPANSSYNRMLLHRTAAFFGMEHNVDSESQQCVIVNVTKTTRIPDVRFKALIRDHREDTRKSILKRDAHSFDEPRQSSYLCPDRGMLDRKAKSFEEREEDYERVRNRIFSRTLNGSSDSPDENASNGNWANSIDQQAKQHHQNEQQQQTHQSQQQGQQLQQPQHRNRNSNVKITKIQNTNENRDSRDGRDNRSGAVSKTQNFGGYNCPPNLRGDPTSTTKISNSRTYSKQESSNSNNSSQWRLSPSNSGSSYSFDASPAIAAGTYQSSQVGTYSPHHQQQPATQSKNKAKVQQINKNVQYNETTIKSLSAATNTSDEEQGFHTCDSAPINEPLEVTMNDIELDHGGACDVTPYTDSVTETSTQLTIDECDNAAENCLSVTTTTHTKNYDRIEVQKFKHQATSPNIPSDKEDTHNQENSTSLDGSETRDETPSRNQQASGHAPPADTSTKQTTTVAEEPKTSTWTYTTSYQAPDGSTIFHTTTTPNGNPYCTTTYQQAPDGSIYAVPQGMVYAYPQQVEGEVQGFLMPIFETNSQRNESASLIPAGTQAIYPSNNGTATMMPIATAFPTTQFAPAATPIYPTGQLIYASDQFATNGGALTTAAPPPGGQLHQIPMTTYPIGYPYPYNGGYWGQNITYYVPQQTIGNNIAATPLLPAPTQAPSSAVASAGTMTGAHVAGGVTLTNLTPTAAGPSSGSQISLTSGNVGMNSVNGHTTYQTLSGTAYFGTGRIKRPNAAHFANSQPGGHHHHQIVATIPSGGGATATYQLGHAVPTLTLATATNAVAGSNDLSGSNAQAAAPMYTLPQHTAIFPANLYSYGSSPSATAGPTPPSHVSGNTLTPAAISSCVPPHGAPHAAHNNTVISNQQFYSSHPQVHAPAPAPTIHTPGPAAIPIVDPATLTTSQTTNNNSVTTYGTQSTPSTPHSLPAQIISQRNPPLFSTPPIVSSSGNMYTNTSSSHYYGHASNAENQQSTSVTLANSTQSSCGISTYDKRSNSNNVKKPSNYSSYNSNMIRHIPTNSYIAHNSSGKSPLLTAVETPRSSPNTGYHPQNQRNHILNKRNNDKSAQQTSLLSGQYPDASTNKPPIRLNAAAASFRQKSTTANVGGGDFRRCVSQRNSPATNSSSNDTSNNNSPNSIAGTSSNSAATTPNTPIGTFITNGGTLYNTHSTDPHQPQSTSTLYIQRGSYIPATIQQNNNLSAGGNIAAASQQPNTSTVLSNTVAATATIGTYNPAAASGVYFKYGQTYFAHPSVSLPNSRRSPSTDIRPPMAQVTGMYPAVNMMIPAPSRHAQGRNPHVNYRGTRPPR